MKCSGCGAEVDKDAAFCPKCGTKVGAAPTIGPNTSPEKTPDRTIAGSSDSETKLWSGGYSGKAMVGSWIMAVLVTIGLGVGCVLMPDGIPVFLGIMGLIWLLLVFVLMFRKMNIHYELTTQRFIHQSGILTRTSDRIEMIDVDDVRFTQSVIQRMLNVGTIKLSSSDRTHPELHLIGIDNVKHVADLIDDARRKERRKRGLHIENI